MPAADLSGRAASAALALLRTAHDAGFRGADPFDALIWPHWPKVLTGGRRRRTVLVQVHARVPVDLRRLYRRDNPIIPKALGVFGSTALQLQAIPEAADEARDYGIRALEMLEADRTNGDQGWSYPWDAQARWSFYAAGTPNIVATVYGARPLAAAAEPWGHPEWAQRAERVARWIFEDLLDARGYFTYHPDSDALVHNANLLGAQLVHQVLGEPDVVRRAIEITLDAQQPDGSWPYGKEGNLTFVDNFHTGFNLQCLAYCRELDPAIGEAIQRGTDYWLDRFFLDDGTATLWPNKRWPEDAHATGTALSTMAVLVGGGFVEPARLEATTRYALERMVDGGHAVPRRYRFWRSYAQYIRWCDSHMALGLADAAAALVREAQPA